MVKMLKACSYRQSKSTFEKEREKELELMEQLEDENLSEKPWYLKGEVANVDRPQNSTLEEHLEYDIAVRQSELPCTRVKEGSIYHTRGMANWQGFFSYIFCALDLPPSCMKMICNRNHSKCIHTIVYCSRSSGKRYLANYTHDFHPYYLSHN